MYPYLPSKPLQDGDKLSDTKKVLNNYKTVAYWLLNNAIDHKLMVIDSDTDWNDVDNLSVYRFNSVEGPHAPEEDQIGGHTGIVVCTSAGTGDHFQIAFTSNGAAFRTLNSDWFYIGHGIPADVDINKLVDQETLGKVLQNYYTKPQVNKLIQQVYASLYSNQQIDNFFSTLKSKQSDTDSAQDRQLTRNRSYTTFVRVSASKSIFSNASNIARNYTDILSNSSGIRSIASNEYLDSSNINSLSYSASSSTSALSSKNSSEITSNSASISINNDHIIENISNLTSLSNSTNDNHVYDSEIQAEVSNSASAGIHSNGSDIMSVSSEASSGRSYNFSYFTSVKNSTNSSMDFETSLEFSDASIDNSNYQSYVVTSSTYSNNPSYANASTVYSVLGDIKHGGLQPQTYESKANYLAELNYRNTSVLASYVFDATHWGSSTSTGTDKNAGHLGLPLKEAVESNSVSMDSEITSLAGNEKNLFPLYNMSLEDSAGHTTVGSSSLNPNQYSGRSNALGSIYANASNIDMLASGVSTNTDSLSSVSGSTDDRANSGDNRFNSDETSDTNRFDSGDSRDASEENNISQNSNILTSFVGFMDSQHKPELNYEVYICTANGARTRNSGRTGRVVGYFLINNPKNPNLAQSPSTPSVYSLQTLDGNGFITGNYLANINATQGNEDLSSFHGGDGFVYQSTWIHGSGGPLSGAIDFSEQQQVHEMTCRLTTDPQVVQKSQVSYLSKTLASAAGDKSTPFGSTIASIASSSFKHGSEVGYKNGYTKGSNDGYNNGYAAGISSRY